MSNTQVRWWDLHEWAQPFLDAAGDWPIVGSPSWFNLADDDPAKWAALLDAAQHWALRVETAQQAHADASRAVSGAADWSAVSREIHQRNSFFQDRPWLKRAV
jgi:Protein of unknown function (DUF2742)